ncbi:Uma2 family endonuclease [Oscillatoria salina]|uniref:Uma2 family endonuclease n=1 Tax=Oscillatoria salina TaxID=331517 RepID=UPI001CCEF2DB|nr:Uma2 family endonuclease [Oscillatoria salina]
MVEQTYMSKVSEVSEASEESEEFYIPDAEKLVTEDDTPVDYLIVKQQRLLVSSLYSSWRDRTFIAAANVGIYYTDRQPPIVPDVFLSLNAQIPENWWEKQNRVYMVWRFGKPPEVAVEIVSNKEGKELEDKLRIYELMRVSYYLVYDPIQQLGDKRLRIFELRGMRYFETTETWLEQVQLGVTLWEGEFEGRQDSWLRWCDRDGILLPTGDERAETAEQRAETAEQRAETAEQRAETAEQRAELLARRLREMGVDPDNLS